MGISSAGWSFLTFTAIFTSRHFSRQPQPQERRRKIPGRILQQQCWSTRVKARLQRGSWRKISDIKSSGTNDILHGLTPKSRNEGKLHRIRFISRARKAPSADHICFYVFTTLALSTHGNHWRLAQLSHGTSSRLPQPAVLSNVNWARPRSV